MFENSIAVRPVIAELLQVATATGVVLPTAAGVMLAELPGAAPLM
jgi:hypothetical protein